MRRGYSAVTRHSGLLWGLARSSPDARARVDAAHLQTWLKAWFDDAAERERLAAGQ